MVRQMATMLNVNRAMIEQLVREVVTQKMGTPDACQRKQVQAQRPNLLVNVSARHMHLTQEDLEKLFGPGYQLSPMRPLYQEGHFAAKETVTLIGPRSRLISNLRILGPCRKMTQIELAFTDAVSLGIENLPVRLSGDIAGTPGAFVLGPAGMLELKEGVIRAARHVHLSPADAAYYGVQHKDLMKLRVGGPTGCVLGQVIARVDPASKLEVHIDTDEANGCGLHLTEDVELIKE
jgi:putative phosphotransacetylase